MGKAYSDKEREEIRTRVLEAALDLYHANNSKSLNISEITKRAGISQGGFYNFWQDKEALILDIVKYRADQKLDLLREKFKVSLNNPADFLINAMYNYGMDLKIKADTNPLYANSFSVLLRDSKDVSSRIEILYADFIQDLADYWVSKGLNISVDKRGIINSFTGIFILFSNSKQFDDTYFEEILKIYIESTIKKYIH
jgi:AcrR family transcriptional regulator